MAFEDLKERLQTEMKSQWEKFQETSLYIQTKERYENLTPTMQKVTLTGVVVLVLYIFLSFPFSYYSTSGEYVTQFEDTRQTIRDMLKASREAQETPDIPTPPAAAELKIQVDSQLQAARLLPEQIIATEVSAEKPVLLPGNLSQSVLKIVLSKLNLRQVVDLGYQFQSINPSVKMMDLVMEANQTDPRYYDATYKLAILAVPSQLDTPEPPEPKPKKGN